MTSTLKKWPIFGLLKPDFISKIHMVLVYGDLGNYCLIVTKDQMVYALGNECECCIKKDCNNGQSIICPKRIDTLCGQKIKTMAYGKESYVLVLTENGKVHSWGSRRCDSNNRPDCFCHNSVLNDIELNDVNNFVVDIACGTYHSMALTNTGNVYLWRYDTCQEMCAQHDRPKRVPTGQIVIQFRSISCGANHCVAVTCNGQVYTWDSNSNSKCQSSGNQVCKRFRAELSIKQITYLSGTVIEKVICGYNHTLALSDKGTLYSWGDNTYGQLGVISDSKQDSSLPIAIPRLLKVLDMAASNCANISVAMGVDHQIFIWGNCLGKIITLPTLISVDNIHDAFALYASPNAMHQPFVIDDEEKKEEGDVETMNIMDHLMAAFDDKTTSSDLTIEVQGKPIYVHKAILKIRSKYFKVMFQGDWKENNDSVITICEFSYVAYRAFLRFLYTDEIDARIPTENVFELLQLADLYDDDNLKASYTGVLTQRISTANTALFYSVAVQYNNSTTSDLTIEVEGKPIYVHKAILKIRSKYFKVMFQGDWKENNESVVRIREFSYVAYRAFLRFVYTDEIDATIPTENVSELFQLADLYDDDNFKARYAGILTQIISASNTALFYSIAVQYNKPVLKRHCIRFAVKHMTEISKSSSFSELTLETMRSFILEVGDEGAFKN